ncbi:biliverdin-producing heme oxygenase [Candidatus Oscillochloris fontis]|uniref:biliverdin-producing heme oxygenase n=1 Tax=Candidatus Oscillochloris fontis TaxID=2496868 RepID=UPI00137575EE|nr:biliverdin-producing heme oxygenase [Candidatus Oscillochloris fontis]
MQQATPIIESLQASSYDQNVRIGELTFFTTEKVDPVSYAALLRGLTVVYDSFEYAIAQSGDPVVQALWAADLRKQAMIRHDMSFVAMHAREIPALELSAEVLAEHIRMRSLQMPRSLLGTAYALATWYMGGDAFATKVGWSVQLREGAGLSFFNSFNAWGQTRWPQFAAQMDALQFTPEVRQQVLEAAYETLDGIEQMIGQIYPINDNPISELVMLINPLGGNHPITNDMEEIKAVFRSHRRIDKLFPFMELRYGLKGRRFSWSDGCWIASLLDEGQESINQQVRWLTRLMARRGMPQWFMECHLILMTEDLTQARPYNQERYLKLSETARVLAEERRASINDANLVALDNAFYARVGQEWRTVMPNCGGLIASAVADDRNGVPHALEAFMSWMTDSTRFPEVWINAAHETIEMARRL